MGTCVGMLTKASSCVTLAWVYSVQAMGKNCKSY